MMKRECERCGEALDVIARSDARFCSTRCRVAAHRAAKRLPAPLVEADRWVRRDAAKRPLRADGKGLASSTDAATWTTFDAAQRSAVGNGLGFVFDGSGIVGVDLDGALTADGALEPWAAAFLATLPATYTEISPSGRGLHVYGYGHVARGRRVAVGSGAVEVYATGRFFTVTARPFRNSPSALADLGDLEALLP